MSDVSESSEGSEVSSDVHALEVDGRRVVLVGTAHISQESVDLVSEVIAAERPDTVCIELDAQRYTALKEERRWESLDLRQLIRDKQLATLLANLVLTSYQRRLGVKLGVTPGAELLAAAAAAEERSIPIVLCDREIRVTLRRAWGSLSFFRKMYLLSALIASLFEDVELSEDDLREIRKHDVLNQLMAELGEAMPAVKRVLIDERDAYLATRILEAEGERVVAVVGAGHVEGMIEALRAGRRASLEELEVIPPVSPIWKVVGWAIPAAIVAAIAYIGATKGPEAAGANALYWFLANSIPSGIGAIVAAAHPATVATAFFAAPFTSLTPLIGVGYLAAFVQAWVRPPKVREFQTVGDDFSEPKKWWSNHLLRVMLVFILTTMGSLLGSVLGGFEIFKNLF